MKLKFTSILTLLLLLVLNPENVLSQVQNEANISSTEMMSLLNTNQIPLHVATNVEGSPYMFDEFYKGVVALENGHTTEPLQIRYNTYTQSVDFMAGELAFNVEGEEINWFTFSDGENDYKIAKGFDARGLSEDDFVEVASEGEATFIIRHHTNFFENAATYGQATKENRYVTSEVFYLKVGDDGFNRIRRPNQRRILTNFDRFEDKLEQYAEQNNIDFSKKDDVARLVRYYNSLVE